MSTKKSSHNEERRKKDLNANEIQEMLQGVDRKQLQKMINSIDLNEVQNALSNIDFNQLAAIIKVISTLSNKKN